MRHKVATHKRTRANERCVAVLYTRWAQAEAAAEALDGAAALTGGQGRPLVVHFANPRKPPPGLPAEPGLAPKKLFVGQVAFFWILIVSSW